MIVEETFFRRAETKEPHDEVREVFVAVDPNGGASSEGNRSSK